MVMIGHYGSLDRFVDMGSYKQSPTHAHPSETKLQCTLW